MARFTERLQGPVRFAVTVVKLAPKKRETRTVLATCSANLKKI